MKRKQRIEDTLNDELIMTPVNLLDVPDPWPRTHRPWNVKLIPTRLIELAKRGVYYDSKMLP